MVFKNKCWMACIIRSPLSYMVSQSMIIASLTRLSQDIHFEIKGVAE